MLVVTMLAAPPVRARGRRRINIIAFKQVPPRAACLARSLRAQAVAAQGVFAVRNHLHVVGVHAESLLAEMIDEEPHRNRTKYQFVEGAMCVDLPSVLPHTTIRSRSRGLVGRPGPYPAGAHTSVISKNRADVAERSLTACHTRPRRELIFAALPGLRGGTESCRIRLAARRPSHDSHTNLDVGNAVETHGRVMRRHNLIEIAVQSRT